MQYQNLPHSGVLSVQEPLELQLIVSDPRRDDPGAHEKAATDCIPITEIVTLPVSKDKELHRTVNKIIKSVQSSLE